MKIIKQGTPPSKPWWVGLKLNCSCGAIVELEDGDCVTDYSDMTGYARKSECSVRCECCLQKITFANPVGRFVPPDVPQWPSKPAFSMKAYDTAEGAE